MTGTGAPIECFWTGQVFEPVSPYMVRRADKEFARGEVLRLHHEAERSTKSHNHLFIAVEEAWKNLPPLMAERFNSPEALRKYCLVKAGHCYSDSITCPSHADALRVAAFIRGDDEFAVVTINKNVLTRYRPKSMSKAAMPNGEFKKAKEDVLRVLGELIGVSGQELSDAAERAA